MWESTCVRDTRDQLGLVVCVLDAKKLHRSLVCVGSTRVCEQGCCRDACAVHLSDNK